MKFHISTGLLTLGLCATNFASAAYYFEDTKLDVLNEDDEINVFGCNVEVNSVNGGITVYCYSQEEKESNGWFDEGVITKKPASFKVNSNLVINYSILEGLSSSNAASIIASEITTKGQVTFEYANVQALEGDVTVSGKLYDDGFIASSSITNTNLIADKGSVNITGYLTMGSGTISAAESVNITNSTVTISGLSAQKVNINEDGVLNIAEAGRVELGEVAVGTGASLGIDGATLVFNEESTITLAEGATLTAFDNVSFEFIMDADSDGAYNFDVFSGIENVTDESSLALIQGFEEAFKEGKIGITLKGMSAEGELIDMDASYASVTMENGTLSIRGTVTIPEPTTATLSLLALAALAARRRR